MEIDLSDAKPIRARRTHRKSRLGCANCKKRRIKVRLLALAITCCHICHILFTLSLYIFQITLCFPTFSNYYISRFLSLSIFTLCWVYCAIYSASLDDDTTSSDRKLTRSSATRKDQPAPTVQTIWLSAHITLLQSHPDHNPQTVQNLPMGGRVQADTDLNAMRQADLDRLSNYPKVSHPDLPNRLEHNVVSHRA